MNPESRENEASTPASDGSALLAAASISEADSTTEAAPTSIVPSDPILRPIPRAVSNRRAPVTTSISSPAIAISIAPAPSNRILPAVLSASTPPTSTATTGTGLIPGTHGAAAFSSTPTPAATASTRAAPTSPSTSAALLMIPGSPRRYRHRTDPSTSHAATAIPPATASSRAASYGSILTPNLTPAAFSTAASAFNRSLSPGFASTTPGAPTAIATSASSPVEMKPGSPKHFKRRSGSPTSSSRATSSLGAASTSPAAAAASASTAPVTAASAFTPLPAAAATTSLAVISASSPGQGRTVSSRQYKRETDASNSRTILTSTPSPNASTGTAASIPPGISITSPRPGAARSRSAVVASFSKLLQTKPGSPGHIKPRSKSAPPQPKPTKGALKEALKAELLRTLALKSATASASKSSSNVVAKDTDPDDPSELPKKRRIVSGDGTHPVPLPGLSVAGPSRQPLVLDIPGIGFPPSPDASPIEIPDGFISSLVDEPGMDRYEHRIFLASIQLVEGPWKFFVISNIDLYRRQRLCIRMWERYTDPIKLANAEPSPASLRPGLMIACVYMRRWCRARILSVLPGPENTMMYRVLFVDFGPEETVELNQIKYLYRCFKKAPCAIHCRLSFKDPRIVVPAQMMDRTNGDLAVLGGMEYGIFGQRAIEIFNQLMCYDLLVYVRLASSTPPSSINDPWPVYLKTYCNYGELETRMVNVAEEMMLVQRREPFEAIYRCPADEFDEKAADSEANEAVPESPAAQGNEGASEISAAEAKEDVPGFLVALATENIQESPAAEHTQAAPEVPAEHQFAIPMIPRFRRRTVRDSDSDIISTTPPTATTSDPSDD